MPLFNRKSSKDESTANAGHPIGSLQNMRSSFQVLRGKHESNARVMSSMLESILPESMKQHATKVEPVITFLGACADFFTPYYMMLIDYVARGWKWLEPYHPDLLLPMLVGLMMMLFGGYFMMIIACIEAYRICGWQSTRDSILVLYEDYKVVKAASDKDNQVDEDGDGIADVLQISRQDLLTRKFQVFLKASQPDRLQAALSALYQGFVAVLATLKIQFSRTITLGVSIGEVMTKPGLRICTPLLKPVVPEEYQKWIPVALAYLFRTIGISIAWTIHRILTAFHSAARGAQIFTDAFAVYTARLGYKQLSEGYYDEVFAFFAATFGLWLQLSTGFHMPWFMAIPLFPLLWFETVLGWLVVYDVY